MRKGSEFKELVQQFANLLPDAVPYKALYESVRTLAGAKLTRKVIDETCWRLAGNVPRLKRHRPVPPWQRQPFCEWVPAQITRVKFTRGGRGQRQLGHEMTFRILAGTSCPHQVYQWWSRRKSAHMARFRDAKSHGFAFSRPKSERANTPPACPFHDPKEFYSLRCMLLIRPEYCDEDGPGFREVGFTSSVTTWNREINKMRARLEPGYDCPHGFSRQEPCYRCPIGQDACPAAVHAKTYEFKPCDRCEEEEAPFDPVDLIHNYCVNCVEDEVVHPKEI